MHTLEDWLIAAGLLGSLVASVWKALPAATRARVEAEHPRVANVLRGFAAFFADVPKFVAVARAVVRGTAKSVPETPAEDLTHEAREAIPPAPPSDPDVTPPECPSAIRKRRV